MGTTWLVEEEEEHISRQHLPTLLALIRQVGHGTLHEARLSGANITWRMCQLRRGIIFHCSADICGIA